MKRARRRGHARVWGCVPLASVLVAIAAGAQPSSSILGITTPTGDSLAWDSTSKEATPATVAEALNFSRGAITLNPSQDTITSAQWRADGQLIGSAHPATVFTLPAGSLSAGPHDIELVIFTAMFPQGTAIANPAPIQLVPDQLYCGLTLAAWRSDSSRKIYVAAPGQPVKPAQSPNPDLVLGTSGNDLDLRGDFDIILGGGDDCIYGFGGNDTIRGGSGDDEIHGGAGNDTIDGDSDDDLIFGGSGVDNIDGDSGRDTIYGGPDGDDLKGDSGRDTIHGGPGDDTINGDSGEDTIYGGAGIDTINGDSDADTIYGGDGGDIIDGDAGGELICGAAGDDDIDGRSGNDQIDGGPGSNDYCRGGSGVFQTDTCWACETRDNCDAGTGSSPCPQCGDGAVGPGEQCDPPSQPGGTCSATCQFEESIAIAPCLAGGSATITLSGISLTVEGLPPDDAAASAQALAAAINGHEPYADLDIRASANGSEVIITGALVGSYVLECLPAIPVLPLGFSLILGLAITAGAWRRL